MCVIIHTKFALSEENVFKNAPAQSHQTLISQKRGILNEVPSWSLQIINVQYEN
jgi:hypothetical protein